MKKSKFLAVVAFLAAVASVFAFTPPPPTPWGKHPTLGVLQGTIVGTNNCDIQSGFQCQVTVGTGPNAQNVDAFSDATGATNQDDSKRLRRTSM